MRTVVKPKIARQIDDRSLSRLEQVGAGLGVLPRVEAVPDGPYPPANPAAGLDHSHVRARGLEARAAASPARPAPATRTRGRLC